MMNSLDMPDTIDPQEDNSLTGKSDKSPSWVLVVSGMSRWSGIGESPCGVESRHAAWTGQPVAPRLSPPGNRVKEGETRTAGVAPGQGDVFFRFGWYLGRIAAGIAGVRELTRPALPRRPRLRSVAETAE